MAFPIKTDEVQGAQEGGPRQLALLRRILRALEILVGEEVPDPGKVYEDPEATTWPDED